MKKLEAKAEKDHFERKLYSFKREQQTLDKCERKKNGKIFNKIVVDFREICFS